MMLIMRILLFTVLVLLQREVAEALAQKQEQQANLPPRGWNSYDSFSWIISEEEFLQNAEIVSQRLLTHGYQYVVVDYLWYRRKVPGAYTNSLGLDVIDEWGKMIHDLERWPSSRGGKGFSEVAKKVHACYGFEVWNPCNERNKYTGCKCKHSNLGHNQGAYEESGRNWRATDIGLKEDIDFSAAKMVGAQGLKGKSWPDLDMLPLGWLTDPGSNEGPHRISALILDEQRTQVH
ncbi:hypothetical protein C5167_021804 [Papaver somniferum]|uniref:Alpha-galactosidase n=1 Tax=Papaver somniferum TaxID=3469 RepID=A0A4Y7JJ54_PAPSO|nr:hypothetical protein C5167_021804 [Papaver somniferum]